MAMRRARARRRGRGGGRGAMVICGNWEGRKEEWDSQGPRLLSWRLLMHLEQSKGSRQILKQLIKVVRLSDQST